jgi:hypothetical protein
MLFRAVAAGFLLLGLPAQVAAYTVAPSCPNFTDITAPTGRSCSAPTVNHKKIKILKM